MADYSALEYHSRGRKGKIEVIPTKPCYTQRDLSLAYTPGVAEPCRVIYKDPEAAYQYTAKGNLVAVITNGTAVLGLGDIGPLAGKPVMEGKGVLFKRFADIDVFDLELNAPDPELFIQCVKALEPTLGGVNLEDIKAPECFEIEERLAAMMDIPVFHDDQHGTAIISGAAFLNALELTGRKIEDVKVVFSGAGAASIATARLYVTLGVRKENILLTDSNGVVYKGRPKGMNVYKEMFAVETDRRTLADALVDADAFVGCSAAGLVTQDMVKVMAPNAIVFAMANPDPEITYEDAKAARPDVIMATGRSDYPNQFNNVLGFPFIFRGALDVRARKINDEMKLACVKALAALAKEDVPDTVLRAYGLKSLRFGPEYIIPKPFDPRVLLWVAPAVAKAAMDSGVARQPIEDFDAYRARLERIHGPVHEVMRPILRKAKNSPKRVVFPEGDEEKILRACQILVDERLAQPILLGHKADIEQKIQSLGLHIPGVEIIDPTHAEKHQAYADAFFGLRGRKGVTRADANRLVMSRTHYGLMMVCQGDADGLVCGLTKHYQETIRPALQLIRTQGHGTLVSGTYVMIFRDRLLFFADCTVNIEPTSAQLAQIAINTAKVARAFNVTPRVAMLSFSNFGSAPHPLADKVRQAVEQLRVIDPRLEVDGEMQADTAVVRELVEENFPFCRLTGSANVLIFPDLQSGNIAYKLLQRLGGATAIGPLLIGMNRPVNVLQMGADVQEIVNITAITSLEAQDSNFLASFKSR
ncbi:MAG: NADP-dependent malic enzyme [Myxococcota bacterium]